MPLKVGESNLLLTGDAFVTPMLPSSPVNQTQAGNRHRRGNMRNFMLYRRVRRPNDRLHRTWLRIAHWAGVASILLAGLAGPSIAVADSADPAGVIQGCLNVHTGRLRVVEEDTVCRRNEEPISWNRQGPAGSAGAEGPAGAPGVTGRAFHKESRTPITVGTSFAAVLDLNLPAGSYAVTATILLNNLGSSRVPVLCVLSGPTDSSVISAVQLEPEVPQTEGRASAATLPVSLATSLSTAGRIELQCVSNTGPGGATAAGSHMQMTAITVAAVTRQ